MDEAPSVAERRTFGVLFAAGAFLFLWTVSPIWVPVFLGVLLAVVANPLKRRLERRVKHHPRLVAAALTALTVALGTGLALGVGYVVLRELVRFLDAGTARAWAQAAEQWLHSRRATALLGRLGATPDHLIAAARGHAATLESHLTAILSSLVAVTSSGLLTLLLAIVTSYYLLLEGPTLQRDLIRLLPLPEREAAALIAEFREAIVGIALGIGAIAIYQGVTAGLGFWIFGVSRPLVWGALTGVVSLIPAVGTALTCVPILLALALSGHAAAAVGLCLFWLVIVVVLANYLLLPRVMRGRMRMHALLVLLSLFGGIEAFGPLGLVLGPLFCALFVALVRIYDRDYRPARARAA